MTPDRLGLLAPASRRALARLAGRAWTGDHYLAGGAALALYLGHREVHGLDLMSATERLVSPGRRDLLADLLEIEPATRVETARDGYLFARWPEEVALRFFWYPYPLAEPLEEAAGVPVAALPDLALMKLGALISRGSRRDFVELYLISRVLPLAEVLARSGEKFGHVGDFPLQAWKALADFSAAEDEPMPELLAPLAWSEVREWALAEAAAGGRAALTERNGR